MTRNDLQRVADTMVRRAQQRGYVVASEIRAQLLADGLDETQWKDVVALARPTLRLRSGRYHYEATVSDPIRKEQDHQRDIHKAVRQLMREYRSVAKRIERREQNRMDFIQPVRVRTEHGREHIVLSRDLSATGIRLIGTRSLLGQKVWVEVPKPGSSETPADMVPEWSFLVRILWTCAVAEDLFENGGSFIEVQTSTNSTSH